MTRPAGPGQPIGFWIKQVDAMFEESIGRLLTAQQLTRRHWQLLNVLSRGPVSRTGCDEQLQVFLEGDGAATSAPLLDQLVRDGLAQQEGDGFLLTSRGLTVYRDLQEKVGSWRSQMMAGISADAYQSAVEVLQRMCANMRGGAAP